MNLDVLRELDKSILLAFNGGDNLFIDYFVDIFLCFAVLNFTRRYGVYGGLLNPIGR